MAGELDEVLKSYHIVDFKEDDEPRQRVGTSLPPSHREESTFSTTFVCSTSLTKVPNPRNARDTSSGLDVSDAVPGIVPGIEPTPGPRDDPTSLCTYVHPVSETQPSASGVLALPGEPTQHFIAGNMVNQISDNPADGFQNHRSQSNPSRSTWDLHVCNFPKNTSESALLDHFKPLGGRHAKIKRSKSNSSSYAFVGFNEYEEAANAFAQFDGTNFFGRPLKISFARDSFNDKFPYAEIIPNTSNPAPAFVQKSKSCCAKISSSIVEDEKKVSKKYFDGFYIYCDDDEESVWKLNDILTKFLTLRGNRPPSFCLDFSELHHPSLNKLDFVEEVLTRSSYCFVIFSNNTAKDEEEEGFLKHQKDQALWKMITGQKSAVVVPVIIHKEARVNGPLNIYHPLKVFQLLCNKTLDEVEDVSLLTEKDFKSNILENIKRLLNKGSMQERVVLEDDFSNSHKGACSRSASPRLSPSPHQQIIQEQNVYLVDNVNPDNGLLNHLFSKKVINFREKETIASKPTFFVKNEELLRLLYMKSQTDFDSFLEALRLSNQSHIADKLVLKS